MVGRLAQLQYALRGPDQRVLTQLVQQVQKEVEQVSGAVDVGLSTRGQKPELEVELNRGLAGQLGVMVGQVAQPGTAAGLRGPGRGRLGGPER